MGGFWGGIAKTTTGAHRSTIDQNRMQLMQQLLAAYMNTAAFGSSPTGLTLTQAGIDFCSSNAAAILNDAGILGNFNQSGDNLNPTTPNPLANISVGGKTAKADSDLSFWDVMPGDAGYPISTDSGWS
jgi:hypothetical protein